MMISCCDNMTCDLQHNRSNMLSPVTDAMGSLPCGNE